jgi:diacylglycerol kinase family enzyme
MQDGRRPLFIVFNPGSGSQDKLAARNTIEEVLRAAGHPHRFFDISGADVAARCREAASLAAEQGGAIVSVGGDGTLNAAAQAAMNHGCVLGVVPQGTFNVFAREHGIPLGPAEAARLLIDGEPRSVRIGSVNQFVFLVNASLGLYPKLLADREQAKRKLGRKRWVAVLAALKTLAQWHAKLALEGELDGRPVRALTASVFVSNNRLQLETAGAAPEFLEQVEGARLVGLAVRPLSASAKVRLVADAILGRFAEADEVDTFAFGNLTVTSRGA